MDKYLEAEKELAELMGWEGLSIAIPSLGKTPRLLPSICIVSPQSGILLEADLPHWTRDDAAAFRLIVEHEAFPFVDAPTHAGSFVMVSGYPDLAIPLAEHPDDATAIRYAIVQAVISRLKIARKWGIPSGN